MSNDSGPHAASTLNRVLNPVRVPAAFSKPARALLNQRDLARDIVLYLIANGEMSLANRRRLTIDTRGKILYPRPQDQLFLKSRIAGVTYVKPNGTSYDPLPNVHPAFAIVLHRLAVFLKERWGVTKIYSGGIGYGRGGDERATDCHNTGRCIDFWGAETARSSFMVARDWGQQAFLIKGGDKKDTTVTRWPSAARTTYYRLDTDHVHPPGADRPARDFFRSVYEFATQQCEDMGPDASPSKIGDSSSIIHPDHPTSARETHQDHLHFQIGEAFH